MEEKVAQLEQLMQVVVGQLQRASGCEGQLVSEVTRLGAERRTSSLARRPTGQLEARFERLLLCCQSSYG